MMIQYLGKTFLKQYYFKTNKIKTFNDTIHQAIYSFLCVLLAYTYKDFFVCFIFMILS